MAHGDPPWSRSNQPRWVHPATFVPLYWPDNGDPRVHVKGSPLPSSHTITVTSPERGKALEFENERLTAYNNGLRKALHRTEKKLKKARRKLKRARQKLRLDAKFEPQNLESGPPNPSSPAVERFVG